MFDQSKSLDFCGSVPTIYLLNIYKKGFFSKFDDVVALMFLRLNSETSQLQIWGTLRHQPYIL